MDKQSVYDFLERQGVPYEVTEHGAVYTMAELSAVTLPYPEDDAKNLFVRDDKRRQYYLITVKGDKRVDLKAFRREHSLRPLTFASPEELSERLALLPGSVTPLGLLNEPAASVKLFLDGAFLTGSGRIGVHPNDNTATVWLKTVDLVALLQAHGNEVEIAEL